MHLTNFIHFLSLGDFVTTHRTRVSVQGVRKKREREDGRHGIASSFGSPPQRSTKSWMLDVLNTKHILPHSVGFIGTVWHLG